MFVTFRSISILGLLASFASSVLCSMLIRARGGVPRPRDSSTPRGFTTALERQEGQQLPLGTICHGDVPLWPFQRCRLESFCVGRLHVRTHVAAALLPQWTSERACERGSANNTTSTLPGTLPRCWPSSAMLRPCTSQAFQCGAKSRTARHFRTFPSCCLTRCYNTQSLKA